MVHVVVGSSYDSLSLVELHVYKICIYIKLYVFKLSISKNVFVRYFYVCIFN